MLIDRELTFRTLDNVSNPRSIHGIYPYRGKLSPLDAGQILDQLPVHITLLDPFCGSGTIVYEAAKRGMCAIGVDNNPIAVQIARGKLCRFNIDESLERMRNVIKGIDLRKKISMPEKAVVYFHPETANEIMHLLKFYHTFNDYEKAAFLGAICLAARACNNFKWSSTQIGRLSDKKQYVNFFDKFMHKLIRHAYHIQSGKARIILGDTRELSKLLPPKSVDVVYTSPPYFDALDYTSYYTRIIHHIFENDISQVKAGLIQNRETYEKDMIKCFDEIDKVTADNALIIFIVGDKKFGNTVINGGQFFSSIIRHSPERVIEREYTKTASKIWDKINKTRRKEQIIVWDKSKW